MFLFLSKDTIWADKLLFSMPGIIKFCKIRKEDRIRRIERKNSLDGLYLFIYYNYIPNNTITNYLSLIMGIKTQKPAGAGSSVCFVVRALLYIFQYKFSHSQKEYIIAR